MKIKNIYIKKSLSLIIIALALTMTTQIVSAQSGNEGGGVTGNSGKTVTYLQNPLKANNVTEVLTSMVDLAIFLGVILAVFMFIFIGFKFVMAQGDPGKLKEARNWFLYAAIGTAVLISSKVIVEVIKTTFISAGVVDKSLFDKKI